MYGVWFNNMDTFVLILVWLQPYEQFVDTRIGGGGGGSPVSNTIVEYQRDSVVADRT